MKNLLTAPKIMCLALTFCLVALLFVGCKKDVNYGIDIKQNEEVSKVSLQRLAEMDSDENVAPELYESIRKRVQSLSQDEYNTYFKFWVENGIQRMIDKKIISKDQKESEIKQEYEKRNDFNLKAKSMYNLPMYQLPTDRQMNVVSEISNQVPSNKQARVSSCPTYYYPSKISNDGTGTYNYVGVYSAGNPGTSDCDWEVAYNLGSILAQGKVRTTTARASAIFLAGGINYRRPNAPENVAHRRFLVGKGRIFFAYAGSGITAAQTFASEVKFR
jgi:hypothetical protein